MGRWSLTHIHIPLTTIFKYWKRKISMVKKRLKSDLRIIKKLMITITNAKLTLKVKATRKFQEKARFPLLGE